MERLTFSEYAEIASEAAEGPLPRQFVRYQGRMMKRHISTWRPISWCDECKADIEGGLLFEPVRRVALCGRCAGSDKEAAAALGIIYD